jgi:hypothetical protein
MAILLETSKSNAEHTFPAGWGIAPPAAVASNALTALCRGAQNRIGCALLLGGVRYTDTHGFTECLFSSAHLLGIRFCPRIKDMPEQRLGRLADDRSPYQHLDSVFDGSFRTPIALQR